MDSEVTILYHEELDPSEVNVMKITTFLGGQIRLVKLREVFAHEDSLRRVVSNDGCLITNAQTLVEASNQKNSSLDIRRILMSAASNVLVYGFKPTPYHSQILQNISSGAFSGVESLRSGGTEFSVEQDSRKICKQFAGLNFGSADPDKDLTFVEETNQIQHSTLIRIGQKPFFVCTNDNDKQLMFLATRQIANLNAKVSAGTSILQYFSGLVPLMMFLFSASPKGFWHNDIPKACFIVDDPLLKKRYGFLDYRKLLKLMESSQFCTSIAFIPWNHRRSNRKITRLFKTYPRKYSLCIHGCDHTRGEFGNASYGLLRNKAQKALDRMMAHQRISDLPFDQVMVFPQGIFSIAATRALKSCDYLAAVNSTLYPIDLRDNALTLGELLEVAVTRFSNFPIFVRRYPKHLADLAFDLFLGKPALLVEHHGYFKCGQEELIEFIKTLNGLEERLEWTNLSDVCAQACLKRTVENGDVHVKFYTNAFFLQNTTDRPQNYVLFRRSTTEELIGGVTVNGRQTEYSQEEDYIRIPLVLDPGQSVDVQLKMSAPNPVMTTYHQRPIDHVRVFARRRLCEFRDNYVDRNRILSRLASCVRDSIARYR